MLLEHRLISLKQGLFLSLFLIVLTLVFYFFLPEFLHKGVSFPIIFYCLLFFYPPLVIKLLSNCFLCFEVNLSYQQRVFFPESELELKNKGSATNYPFPPRAKFGRPRSWPCLCAGSGQGDGNNLGRLGTSPGSV